MNARQELMNYTFISKYARWIEELQRRETWKEAANRVRNMMLEKFSGLGIDDDINWAYDMMLKKKVLGSQRALQFGGKPMMKTNCKGYNCAGTYVDRLRVFQEILWVLLCGTGAGYSVQKHHVEKLPKLSYVGGTTHTHLIEDSIEGWADAAGILLSSYFETPTEEKFAQYIDAQIKFDYRMIRPKGSMLSSGVGKAPGPDGLRNSLEKIRKLLDNIISDGSNRLRPIDAHDIICHLADAVLSGGVRRSACLALFSIDDNEMMTCKTGNWIEENPQRARANNSIAVVRDGITKEVFNTIFDNVKEYGEPGIIFVDTLEHIVNPCAEASFFCYDSNGDSGWQFCNLTNINTGTIKDKEDLFERAKAASLIGTLQAAFTDFEYLGKVTESIVRREALLGVGLSGMMDNYDIVLDPHIQKEAANIVKQTNKKYSKILNINQAARCTVVKPDGSTSSMLGIAPGVGPHHAKRYIRNVQANRDEAPYQKLKSINPSACEPSLWSANGTDDIISFPIEIPNGSKTKNQLPALELLKAVKSTQQNWIIPGTNKQICVDNRITHSVSNTIHVMDNEWDDVADFIYRNRKYFCGISLISNKGDKDFAQTPYTTVHTPREIVSEYGDAALWTSGLIEIGLNAFDHLWAACDFCLIEQQQKNLKQDIDKAYNKQFLEAASKKLGFLEGMRRFANKYFEGDMRRLTYCMKDVYNWKKYYDLTKSFKPVDYTEMIEVEDNTNLEGEVACAGGACLV